MKYLMNRKICTIIIAIFFFGCNGEDGSIGPSGLNSLIETTEEIAGANCEFGGLKVETGLDKNSNGTLDANEILKTEYVCGVAGKNNLVNITDEPPGSNCEIGGVKIDSGMDSNGNGTLDGTEITLTEYVCSGNYDKEIKFNLRACACSYGNEIDILETSLLEFDIRDYSGIDSVVFVIYDIATYDGTGKPKDFASTFELYDITNDTPIAGSSFTSDDIQKGTYIATPNLLGSFPQERVNIGIRVTDEADVNTVTGTTYLILRRY